MLEITAGLHSGRHLLNSSAVIAVNGLPILLTEALKVDELVDLGAFFLGEKALKTSMSLDVSVEVVDSAGVEHAVEVDSSDERRPMRCRGGVAGGSHV